MKKITIMDEPKFSLYCYPDEGIVHHVLHSFIYGEDFRTLMTKGADAFNEYDCNKWLSDDRSNSALRDEDVKWGQENWESRLLDKGWDYWGLVMPEKVVGKMNMRRIVDRYESLGVEVKVFNDPDEGLKWLSSK